jgi:hypothetical protein
VQPIVQPMLSTVLQKVRGNPRGVQRGGRCPVDQARGWLAGLAWSRTADRTEEMKMRRSLGLVAVFLVRFRMA